MAIALAIIPVYVLSIGPALPIKGLIPGQFADSAGSIFFTLDAPLEFAAKHCEPCLHFLEWYLGWFIFRRGWHQAKKRAGCGWLRPMKLQRGDSLWSSIWRHF